MSFLELRTKLVKEYRRTFNLPTHQALTLVKRNFPHLWKN